MTQVLSGEAMLSYLLNRANGLTQQAKLKEGAERRIQLVSAMALLLTAIQFDLTVSQENTAIAVGRQIMAQASEEGLKMQMYMPDKWLKRWLGQDRLF